MKRLYEPRTYYQRISTFLETHRSSGPTLRVSGADLAAFVRSFWLLGLCCRGRREYWRFCLLTLLTHPRQFRSAMELAVIGYHFRRVASTL